MARRGLGAEQIVSKLRQIEVLLAQGKSAALACKDAGVSEQSYYRWRKEYGGLEIDQAKRMKELERANARLKRLVAELSVESRFSRISPRETSSARPAAAGGRGCSGALWAFGTLRLSHRHSTAWSAAVSPHGSS